jgi:hypothetical protein
VIAWLADLVADYIRTLADVGKEWGTLDELADEMNAFRAGWLICFTPAGEVTDRSWEGASSRAAGFKPRYLGSSPLSREVFLQFQTTPVQAARRLRALATIPAPRTLEDARQLDGFDLNPNSDTEFEQRAAQADRDADRDAGEAL